MATSLVAIGFLAAEFNGQNFHVTKHCVMKIMCWLVTSAFVILLFDSSVAAADNGAVLLANVNCSNSLATEAYLEKTLFSDYSPRHRPRRNPQQVVNVTLSLALESIKDIHEKEHQITVAGYLYVNWVDDYLTWKGLENFSCINMLIIPAKSVWLPDIALMNAPRKYDLFEAPGERVRIYNDGYVHFRPGGLFSAACEFDLTYFPFDEQICILRFQSWMFLHTYMAIILENPPITIAKWTENEEWQLIGMSAVVQNVSYSNPSHNYDGVLFILNLKRKVGFYIMNVIIPSIIISFVELVTFALPSHEVIKIHISFTSLLAYTVFQLMIIPEMPQTSEHTPMLSIYIVLEMGFIGFALLGQGFVFLVLDRAEHSKKKAPYRLLYMFAVLVAPFVWVEVPREPRNDEIPSMDQALYDQRKNSESDSEEDESRIPKLHNQLPAYYGSQHYQSLFPFGENYDLNDELKNVNNGNTYQTNHHCKHCQLHCDNSPDRNSMANYRRQTIAGPAFYPRNNKDSKNKSLNFIKWMFIVRVIDRLVAAIYITVITMTPFFMFFIVPLTKPTLTIHKYATYQHP